MANDILESDANYSRTLPIDLGCSQLVETSHGSVTCGSFVSVERIAAIRALLTQFFSYGLSGGTALATQFSVLYFLVQIVGCPTTLSSAVAYACGVPVNYGLQHSFVFKRVGGHGSFFPRYVAVSLSTLVLNTLIFWLLEQGLGIFYFASQVITTAIIVPGRFMINRHVTFRTSARPMPFPRFKWPGVKS